MSVYEKYKNLNRISVKDRIQAFRETTVELLEKGKAIEEIKNTLELFLNDECYEAVEGISLGIEDFKNNPQTKLL